MATGISEDQAGAVVKVVNSTGDQLAGKVDVKAIRTDLKALQTATRADLKAGLLDFQVKFMATQIGVAALIVAIIKLF